MHGSFVPPPRLKAEEVYAGPVNDQEPGWLIGERCKSMSVTDAGQYGWYRGKFYPSQFWGGFLYYVR